MLELIVKNQGVPRQANTAIEKCRACGGVVSEAADGVCSCDSCYRTYEGLKAQKAREQEAKLMQQLELSMVAQRVQDQLTSALTLHGADHITVEDRLALKAQAERAVMRVNASHRRHAVARARRAFQDSVKRAADLAYREDVHHSQHHLILAALDRMVDALLREDHASVSVAIYEGALLEPMPRVEGGAR